MLAVIRFFLIISVLFLSACTPTLQIEPVALFDPKAAALDAEKPDRYWWQLGFGLTWPEDEQLDFSRHLLIAEQLLLPTIIEYQGKLPLWRLHRRAARDAAGHQFSIIFFSDATTAAQINEAITSDPLTHWLVERKMIDETRFAKRSPEEMGRLELTSDPSWPMEIQRSWPYFIMGVSQSWLVMIQELSALNPQESGIDYPALLQHYKQVDARLNSQWRNYGQHAYLHHLSAVFGYEPINIRSSELKTF